MRRRLCSSIALGALLLSAGCADRGVASGPATRPGTGTWVAVWIAVVLAVVVLGALLVRVQDRFRGGDRLATALLTVHAGAAAVGMAVLAGLAVRSWPLADAKAAGESAAQTSLLRISVIDGDPRYFSLMLLVVAFIGGSALFLVTLAARFARGRDPHERYAACGVLALELVGASAAVVRVVQGRHDWQYVLVAAHLPIVAAAFVTCWPRTDPAATPAQPARLYRPAWTPAPPPPPRT